MSRQVREHNGTGIKESLHQRDNQMEHIERIRQMEQRGVIGTDT